MLGVVGSLAAEGSERVEGQGEVGFSAHDSPQAAGRVAPRKMGSPLMTCMCQPAFCGKSAGCSASRYRRSISRQKYFPMRFEDMGWGSSESEKRINQPSVLRPG